MSSDRVHFDLDLQSIDSFTRTAYMKTFGLQAPLHRVGHPGTVTIVCRPSQFARFLIYRNEAGGRNLFKELNPKLVEANPETILDLSTRPKVTC
jgi:hypothetical protein